VLQVVLLQEGAHCIVGRSETFQNDRDEEVEENEHNNDIEADEKRHPGYLASAALGLHYRMLNRARLLPDFMNSP